MRYRKLRIAWTVFCGIAFVLSLSLWYRSFSYWDDAVLRIGSVAIQPISAEGRNIIWIQSTTSTRRFEIDTDPLSWHRSPPGHERHPWLGIGFFNSGPTIWVAHCVLVMASGAFAVIPWLPTWFNLRGVFVVMTVFAVFVGLISWVDGIY
jgi:hypothetical protein